MNRAELDLNVFGRNCGTAGVKSWFGPARGYSTIGSNGLCFGLG